MIPYTVRGTALSLKALSPQTYTIDELTDRRMVLRTTFSSSSQSETSITTYAR
ncbi:hypothetical protein GCM10023185_26710 [Hymenobacter saemangeumensis]|uniref:Uncharacterized protein n=1 Tax=Hymenobacter saemangeumensis TaxID=1084522 RepID=A0ABP8IJJ3_9BACT